MPTINLYAGGLMVQLVFPGADLSTVIWGIAILAASYTLIGGLATWNFLYVAPLLFVVSLAILVFVSLFTAAPVPDVVKRYVWSPAFFRDQSDGLAGTPWYQNYRILSLILLAVTAVFILVWR